MGNTPSHFIKAPKRKAERVKQVTLSDDAKKAYEETIQKRAGEEEYRRHLDPGVRRV